MRKGIALLLIWSAAALLVAWLNWPAARTPAPAAPMPTPTLAPLDGRALFFAKGCATCHKHAALGKAGSYEIGPELTHYQSDPAFVRRWLADPQAVRPGTTMPQLGLSPAEIEALLAFLETNAAR